MFSKTLQRPATRCCILPYIALLFAFALTPASGQSPPSLTTTVTATPQGASFTIVAGPAAAYDPYRVLVRFRRGGPDFLPGTASARAVDAVSGIFLAHTPPGLSVADAVRRYKQNPNVLYAEPDFVVQSVGTTPNDPYWPQQWNLTKISAPAAWDTQKYASDVVVAVIDTGIDFTHPDLAGNVDKSHSFTCINGPCVAGGQDDYGHGTHVAGIIGAASNNATGIAGINWSARMISLKFLDSNGVGYVSDAVTAMSQVASLKGAGLNIRVTNDSWGTTSYSQALKDAMAALESLGIVSVCAAGNSGVNIDVIPAYPAAFDNHGIISVLATDAYDMAAGFTNYGLATVDIAAPGIDTLSTAPTGSCPLCDPSGYSKLSGTSIAAPHVSGVMAALLHLNPMLTSAEARDVLLDRNSYDPLTDALGQSTSTGGRLNFAKAIANPRLSNPGPLNNFPTIANPPNIFASAGWMITMSADASDADAADLAGLRMQWSSTVTAWSAWLFGWMVNSLFPDVGNSDFAFTAPSLARTVAAPYRVSVADNRGGGAQNEQIVTVAPGLQPGLPPSLALNVSSTTGTVGQTITVNFPATDPEGSGLAWELSVGRLNGAIGWCCFTTPSTSITFDTPGVYRIGAQAIDSELNLSARQTVVVTIGAAAGAPPVANAILDTISGTAPLTVNVNMSGSYDPDGSISTYYMACGTGYATGTQSPMGSCTFDKPGSYWLQLVVVDNTGLTDMLSTYVVVTPAGVAIDATPPTVSLTAPASGAVLSGATVVSATASDSASGVAKVDFRLDNPASGLLMGSAADAPYSITWNPAGTAAGAHTIYAIATDNARNAATSAGIPVTIPGCPTNPTVIITPADAIITTSTSKAFSVTIKNNDAAGCGSSTYSLKAAQPPGLTGALSKSSVSLSPGASATVTLTEKSGSTLGTFSFSVTATDTATPTYHGQAAGTLTVGVCTLVNPTVTLYPAINIGMNSSGSLPLALTVRNNNSAACPTATFKLSSTQPSGFSGTLSASSLSVSPGAQGQAILTEKAGTTPGTFTVIVKAVNSAKSANVGYTSATITVIKTVVTASTDSASYKPLSVVTMRAAVAGYSPVSGATVTFTLKKPSGSSTTFKVLTGSDGVALRQYTLAASDLNGTYTVSASTALNRVTYKSTATTFTVAP